MASLDSVETTFASVRPVDMFDGFESSQPVVVSRPETANLEAVELRRLQRELCARVLQLDLPEARAMSRHFNETLIADGDQS